jgi:hypothetical protein
VANDSSNDLIVTTSTNGEGTDWSPDALVGSPAQASKFAPTLGWNAASNYDLVIAYVADNSKNHLLTTTSSNGDATDWSPSALVGNPAQSSQAAPALPNWFVNPIPMVYVANNSKDHLLLTTFANGGTTWSASSKIKDGPRAE